MSSPSISALQGGGMTDWNDTSGHVTRPEADGDDKYVTAQPPDVSMLWSEPASSAVMKGDVWG